MSRFERCPQCPASYECIAEGACILGWIGRNVPALLNPRASDEKTVAERKWQAGLKPAKPQQPCDVGLFSDDAAQLDLCEMFQDPTED
jgi:hypothetical protein